MKEGQHENSMISPTEFGKPKNNKNNHQRGTAVERSAINQAADFHRIGHKIVFAPMSNLLKLKDNKYTCRGGH